MVIKRYPHTATISYYGAGTTNSIGIYTPGTLVTIGTVCNAQPNATGITKYIVGASGDMIGYNWTVFSPLFIGASDVPDDAKITFFNKERVILQLFPYQKHVEIKV